MTPKLRRTVWTCLFLLAWVPKLPAASESAEAARKIAASEVPLDRIAEPLRGPVAELLKQPTAYARGPIEAFPCRPAVYEWLLDRPHLVARGWRALGATCVAIEQQPNGSFCGKDQSGEMHWVSVFKEPGRRIWYAEGSGRPMPLTPKVSGRALLILRYQEVKGVDGRIGIRHRTELFVQCDDKPTAWLARLFNTSAEQAAGRMLQQIEIFYSAMSWYMCEHPDWAKSVLKNLPTEESEKLGALLRD